MRWREFEMIRRERERGTWRLMKINRFEERKLEKWKKIYR